MYSVAANCEAKAATLSDSHKHSPAVFGHRSFSEYGTGEGGVSQYIDGKLYAAYREPNCYLFETDVATVSPEAVDGVHAITPAQFRDISTHLLNIMKSMRIVPNVR